MHLQALTFDALRAVTTGSQEGLLSTVRARLDAGGAATRVLRAVKQTAAYRVEIWFDVPDLDQQAHLHVVANDLRSGAVLDAPPFPLEDYEHAFPLVARIGASKGVVTIAPRDSWLAAGRTRKYPNPLRLAIANFRVRGDAAAPP